MPQKASLIVEKEVNCIWREIDNQILTDSDRLADKMILRSIMVTIMRRVTLMGHITKVRGIV